MKKLWSLLCFFLFLFFTMLCPICKAQFYKSKLMVNEEIVENEDCKNLIEQFYNKIAKSNSMKTSTKKGERVTSTTPVSSFLISDSSDVNDAYNKISDKQNYYYSHENTYRFELTQGKDIFGNHNKKSKKAFSFFKSKLSSALQMGNKVYTIDVKTKDGTTFNDYIICGPKQASDSTYQLKYNNAFFDLLFFRSDTARKYKEDFKMKLQQENDST